MGAVVSLGFRLWFDAVFARGAEEKDAQYVVEWKGAGTEEAREMWSAMMLRKGLLVEPRGDRDVVSGTWEFYSREGERCGLLKKSKHGVIPFSVAQSAELVRYTASNDYFTNGERIRMLKKAIESGLQEVQADLDYPLTRASFPLHDHNMKDYVFQQWMSNTGSMDAGTLIADYFGSEVAFYFMWIDMYTTWLFLPAVVGIAASFYLPSKYEVVFTFAFSLSLVLIATLFLEMWKRQEIALRFHWRDPVQSRTVPQVEWDVGLLCRQWLVSFPISVSCTLLVAVYMLCYFEMDDAWKGMFQGQVTQYIPVAVYCASIPLFSAVYGAIAGMLNRWEAYTTEKQRKSALIFKLVPFKLVNSYLSLYYIMFWKQDLVLLRNQLAAILITYQVIGNVMEVGTPVAMYMFKKRTKKPNRLEEEASMEVYADGVFFEYLEMVIQYGYIFIFGWIWPAACLCAFANNVIEMRSDLFKLCSSLQRPAPKHTDGIKAWSLLLTMMSYLAIITNFAFYIEVVWQNQDEWFPEHSLATKICCIIAVEHLVLLLKAAMSAFIPNEPLHLELESNCLHKQKHE